MNNLPTAHPFPCSLPAPREPSALQSPSLMAAAGQSFIPRAPHGLGNHDTIMDISHFDKDFRNLHTNLHRHFANLQAECDRLRRERDDRDAELLRFQSQGEVQGHGITRWLAQGSLSTAQIHDMVEETHGPNARIYGQGVHKIGGQCFVDFRVRLPQSRDGDRESRGEGREVMNL